jgi:hypothetical protein
MGLYKAITFPFINDSTIDTNDINEAKNYIEDRYRQKNDIESRKWFRTDDGYTFPKPESDGSIILNKMSEWGIICQGKTTDRFDELFNHPNTEKNNTEDEKKKYYVSFEIIPNYLDFGYICPEHLTDFDRNDLKDILIKYYKKEDLIDILLRLVGNEGKIKRIE